MQSRVPAGEADASSSSTAKPAAVTKLGASASATLKSSLSPKPARRKFGDPKPKTDTAPPGSKLGGIGKRKFGEPKTAANATAPSRRPSVTFEDTVADDLLGTGASVEADDDQFSDDDNASAAAVGGQSVRGERHRRNLSKLGKTCSTA